MSSEAEFMETHANILKEMEENSKLFKDMNLMKRVTTVDIENVSVKDLIGKGGFANVKAATIETGKKPLMRQSSLFTRRLFGTRNSFFSSGKKYAIKSLRESLRGSLAFDGAGDLAKEAMFLGTIRHPNIIYLHGVAQSPGRDYFLVIEPLNRTLVDQIAVWRNLEDMQKKLGKTSPMMIYTRLEAIMGLVSALSYLHNRNILYRDLKPANIGFDKYDNLKLFDFGLATELKEVNQVGDDQYHATRCTGTPRYMAREVFDAEPYGLAADMYSFSLILYEIVVLKKAFSYKTMDDHAAKVYRKGKRPKLDRTVPKEVKAWITTGWSNDPTARPKMGTLWNEMVEILVANNCSDTLPVFIE